MREEEKIWRKDAAKELGISLSSLDRAVRAGELCYANWDIPKGAHRYFTRADLENYKRRKPLEQRITADVVKKILDDPLFIEQSTLGKLISKYLRQLPLDIVLEIKTLPPGKAQHNLYCSKFPLLRRDSHLYPDPNAHAATVLALAYLITKEGGVCQSWDFQASDTGSYPWGPDANQALQDFGEDILKRLLMYAHGWIADYGAFKQDQESNIRYFLHGMGHGDGSPGKCIIVDEICLYKPWSGNYKNGTTVTGYLTVPLP
ncbi:helix-turn-helix domain-containing protein [Pseudoflavonifractor phocaeensis]|uniref:helix-turn-helix domain-containing protein n=1 Tax=Pseudoflavonifractor phocaeensis TaxID=1870988 RepID=UPI00195D846A|nr:helix-turn-helix domain-containing protein [Pseudoflavonifractor phocaeensis]MBM6885565.1 helix-turn-helix domain-containing protein [Pseudoflavonifractor phocaeensis]